MKTTITAAASTAAFFKQLHIHHTQPIMDTGEIEKSTSIITVEIVEYIANSAVIKTILKKSSGNISVMSFDSGEGLTEKSSRSTLLHRSLKARLK